MSREIYGWSFSRSHRYLCGCIQRKIEPTYNILINAIPIRWFILIIASHIFFNRKECFGKESLFHLLLHICVTFLSHIFVVVVEYEYLSKKKSKHIKDEDTDNTSIQSTEIQDGVLQLRQLHNFGIEIIHITTLKEQESIILSNDSQAPTDNEVINYRVPEKLFNVAKNVTMSLFMDGKNNSDLTFDMIVENLFHQMDQLEYLEDHIRLEREPINLII